MRSYNEKEADEIFALAAEARTGPGRSPVSSGGMTLEELQAIGREAGIPPERIAEAATTIELRRNVPARRRFLGVPISVSRVVPLPRALTDREWEMLVADVRQTFGARGHVETHGNLRSWTNGNLHVYVEPTTSGYQLRMGTLKGDAIPFASVGLVGSAFTSWMALRLPAGDLGEVVLLGAMSAAALVYSLGRLPGWARTREQQMEYIASRTLKYASGSDPETT